MSAVIVPYSIIKFMDKIDNIWDIGEGVSQCSACFVLRCHSLTSHFLSSATERADEAGKMLAHVLLRRPQVSDR